MSEEVAVAPAADAARTLDWPRPRASLAACVEAAGLWWATATLGLVLVVALLLGMQRHEVQAMQDARLTLTLQQLRERLESDIALGLDLGAGWRTQSLMEEVLARDAVLLALDVFDAEGRSLLSTDRGAIGEPVPAAWRAAAASGQPAWIARTGHEVTLGLAVRGAFGEVAGHVSATEHAVPPPPIHGAVAATLVVWLGFSFLAWRAVRLRLRADAPTAANDPLAPAAARLAQAQQRSAAALARLTREEGPSA